PRRESLQRGRQDAPARPGSRPRRPRPPPPPSLTRRFRPKRPSPPSVASAHNTGRHTARREEVAPMPRKTWTAKRERQYEHIKDGLLDRGESANTAEEIAARTVNKE